MASVGFNAEALVEVEDGILMRASDLKKGDKVKTENGFSRIKIVILTEIKRKIQLCKIGHLTMNPDMIIFYNENWINVQTICMPMSSYIDTLINFVLEDGNTIYANWQLVRTL